MRREIVTHEVLDNTYKLVDTQTCTYAYLAKYIKQAAYSERLWVAIKAIRLQFCPHSRHFQEIMNYRDLLV